ncbi:hypothetical protein WMY93_029674 [Mugilogobius chulae]|uniref:Uncharacterized protein n=1 Tax=Mugilogobius chulae TaxID=88201 RepID=A0AAW0MLP6_9GOBI
MNLFQIREEEIRSTPPSLPSKSFLHPHKTPAALETGNADGRREVRTLCCTTGEPAARACRSAVHTTTLTTNQPLEPAAGCPVWSGGHLTPLHHSLTHWNASWQGLVSRSLHTHTNHWNQLQGLVSGHIDAPGHGPFGLLVT